MIKKLTLSLLLLVIFTGLAIAQTAKATGSVTSTDDRQPVIGASILVEGMWVQLPIVTVHLRQMDQVL